MQRNHQTLTTLIKITAGALLALAVTLPAQAQDKKADPTGTWSWSQPGRNGGPERVTTLKLKLEGEKVTGTVSAPGRGGAQATETAIEDGKLKGDELTFAVSREFNGNKFTTKYSGKVSADAIKGKIESPARGGGDPVSRDWEAKRVVEKK